MNPPEKRARVSARISMVVEKWMAGQVEQCSAVHRVGGYPWYLRLFRYDSSHRYLLLVCDKSKEAELWDCTAIVESNFASMKQYSFSSWSGETFGKNIALRVFDEGTEIKVDISDVSGTCQRERPTYNPFKIPDAVLVFGIDKKKLYVHKRDLIAQSCFFEDLFKENPKKTEFTIKDVTPKAFRNLLNIVYGLDSIPITSTNMNRLMELADRFELKIVCDRVTSYVLSPASSMTAPRRLRLLQNCGNGFLMAKVIGSYTKEQLEEFAYSTEWDGLMRVTTRALLKRRIQMDSESVS